MNIWIKGHGHAFGRLGSKSRMIMSKKSLSIDLSWTSSITRWVTSFNSGSDSSLLSCKINKIDLNIWQKFLSIYTLNIHFSKQCSLNQNLHIFHQYFTVITVVTYSLFSSFFFQKTNCWVCFYFEKTKVWALHEKFWSGRCKLD